MQKSEWRQIAQGLAGAALVLAGVIALGAGAAVLAGWPQLNPVLAMAGLGAFACIALAAASIWASAKAGPQPKGIPKKIAPGAWPNALLVGLVLMGSGGATAVGLSELAWFGLSAAVAALYAIAVLWPRPVRTDQS